MASRSMQYVEVAPVAPLSATSRQTYTYSVSTKDSIDVGSIVTIPFGPRQIQGVILAAQTKKPHFPTKPAVLTGIPPLTLNQIHVAQTIADTMRGGLGFTLRLFFSPTGKTPTLSPSAITYANHRLSPNSKNILKILKNHNASITERDSQIRQTILTQLAYDYAKNHRQVAIIVPEISMIEPFLQQLAVYLPPQAYAGFYAGLSTRITRQIYQQVKHNQLKVIVGTQKTLWLPWQNLGLIMLEQEYYPTHKLWDQYPRLPNRYAAAVVSQEYDSRLLYAGDFPSLWLRSNIESKKVIPAVRDSLHPSITLEASQFSDRRAKNLLPQTFTYRLKAWSKQHKTIFLLSNKRGAWQIAACRACHTASRCADCGATLLIQAKPGKTKGKTAYQLTCRQCHTGQKIPEVCLVCKKGKLQFIWPGIETIELAVHALLPRAKVVRLDAGTVRTQKPDQIAKKISTANIIIGTSAALTHLAGTKIDRVAWLFPEDSLSFPDVRSSERAWYLLARLTQLLPSSGAVVTVTRQEQSIKEIFSIGDDKFFAKELISRQRLFYPPATDMIRLTFSANTTKAATKLAATARQKLTAALPSNKKMIIRGPFASTAAGEDKHSHLLVFGDMADIQPLYKNQAVAAVDYLPERIM